MPQASAAPSAAVQRTVTPQSLDDPFAPAGASKQEQQQRPDQAGAAGVPLAATVPKKSAADILKMFDTPQASSISATPCLDISLCPVVRGESTGLRGGVFCQIVSEKVSGVRQSNPDMYAWVWQVTAGLQMQQGFGPPSVGPQQYMQPLPHMPGLMPGMMQPPYGAMPVRCSLPIFLSL